MDRQTPSDDSMLDQLPAQFRAVRYVGAQIPDSRNGLEQGANCQRFAYAVLGHFGIVVPPWRSSALWADKDVTEPVAPPYRPLDLLLFNGQPEAYGAHIGLWTGADVLHLCRAEGRPAIWPLSRFAGTPRYACLVGAKRFR